MMNKTETNLREQEAPLKNTDKAFVKVNKDGSPGIATETSDKKAKDQTTDQPKEKKDQ
jgi:hypothetical protein